MTYKSRACATVSNSQSDIFFPTDEISSSLQINIILLKSYGSGIWMTGYKEERI
jgi:hypothetical protein